MQLGQVPLRSLSKERSAVHFADDLRPTASCECKVRGRQRKGDWRYKVTNRARVTTETLGLAPQVLRRS